MGEDVIARWRQIAKARDVAGLDGLLAEEVVFRSPVVHTPQRGKAIVGKYLAAALDVLGNESFRYVGEWRAERSAVLEFVTTIGGIEIDGVDIIAWSEAGRIVDFKVMLRQRRGVDEFNRWFFVTFHDAALRYVVFPYPMEEVTGVLELHPDHWTFTNMRGGNGQAVLTGYGDVRKVGEDADGSLTS